jgi:hypothetical protein
MVGGFGALQGIERGLAKRMQWQGRLQIGMAQKRWSIMLQMVKENWVFHLD